MAIGILQIARNSLRFSSIRIGTLIISLPVSVYVATVLIPEEYGKVGFLGLWLMYAALANPGFMEAACREIPYRIGKNEPQEALRVQNIAITSDMLFSLLPFTVILGSSFFFSDPILRTGLIVVAISYAANRLVAYWRSINFAREKFNTVAKGNLLAAIASPVLVAATVAWLKVYALVAVPVVVAIISGIYYWRKGPIDYHFAFYWGETVRLLKIGVVLAAGALAFVGFRIVDRTVIASTLSLAELGLYTFAIGFMTHLLVIAEDFGNVLQPVLWRETGKAGDVREVFADAKRIAIYMALGACILIPLAQLGFYLIVSVITTKYTGSINVFFVLSYNICLAFVTMIPNIILMSSVVNRQKLVLCVYLVGLALNIIFDILVVKLGHGIVGVAWVTIGTQGLATLTLYYLARGYLTRDAKELVRFSIRMVVPFVVCLLFYFLHRCLDSAVSSAWLFAGLSLCAQIVVWSVVISIFYRDYVSISHIKMAAREIAGPIRERFFRR